MRDFLCRAAVARMTDDPDDIMAQDESLNVAY